MTGPSICSAPSEICRRIQGGARRTWRASPAGASAPAAGYKLKPVGRLMSDAKLIGPILRSRGQSDGDFGSSSPLDRRRRHCLRCGGHSLLVRGDICRRLPEAGQPTVGIAAPTTGEGGPVWCQAIELDVEVCSFGVDSQRHNTSPRQCSALVLPAEGARSCRVAWTRLRPARSRVLKLLGKNPKNSPKRLKSACYDNPCVRTISPGHAVRPAVPRKRAGSAGAAGDHLVAEIG